MLTTNELRVLYLLRKHSGRAKRSTLSQAMHRVPAGERWLAFSSCEDLELISSAKTPPIRGREKGNGGRGGLVYWLTKAGESHVDELIEKGQLLDPALETRGAKAVQHAAG